MILAIRTPRELRMASLSDTCPILLRAPCTFSIPQWFGKGAAVPYPRGRREKDSQSVDIFSTGLTRGSCLSEPQHRTTRGQLLFHAHALKPGKLHRSVNASRRLGVSLYDLKRVA